MNHLQIVLDEFNNLGRVAEAAGSSTGNGGDFLGPISVSEYDACVSAAQVFSGQVDADVIHLLDVRVTEASPGVYIARLTVVLTKEA
jgi:hypothetical protein